MNSLSPTKEWTLIRVAAAAFIDHLDNEYDFTWVSEEKDRVVIELALAINRLAKECGWIDTPWIETPLAPDPADTPSPRIRENS